MAKFKVIVSDPATGTSKVVELEEARATPLIGRKIGEVIDGAIVDLPAHKVQLVGGSDKDGARSTLACSQEAVYVLRHEHAVG